MSVSRLTTVGAMVLVTFIFTAPVPAQQICGGITGIPCPSGQFCELADGECCCDFLGSCTDIPGGCPAVCDPVCGCDGRTYGNRCEAHAAGMSVAHTGACEPGSQVRLTGFTPLERLSWEPVPQATAYNVYLQDFRPYPPWFHGQCIYTAVPEDSVLLKGQPLAGQPWMIRVSALLPTGEGPLGSDPCQPGAPTVPCTCSLPADVGPCDATIPRWYHDYVTAQCESFVWGGCDGNANNFETKQECQAACTNPCDQPAVMGECTAALRRWYYNDLSGHCDTFTWGGCGGNGNNFQTVDDCRTACGDICLLPPETGDCDGICPRWHFDPASGQCEMFIWGCCAGNRNNFATEEECEQECAAFLP
jgi:hypothetical protein